MNLIPLQSSDSMVSIPVSETSISNSKRPNITIISATAFLHTSKLLDSHNFKLCLCFSDIQANSTKFAEAPDLSNIPSEYHKFADIFSKTKAKVLTFHYPYNLKINLEKDAQPPVSPIYSLSTSKQETLKKFIKKKDSSLYLFVDFCGLNHIFKKDCYPLLLIPDLLDLPCKAQIYSKIDLYQAYYLVHITNGNE